MEKAQNSGPAIYSLSADEVARQLEVNFKTGLSREELKQRRERYGLNLIVGQKRTPAFYRLLQQFAQPLMYILVVAAVITAFLREYVDAVVIFAVAFVNAVVGFIQENKAEKAIESLSKMIVTEATVRRGGRKFRVNSVDLVPGDIVLLQSGDKVPADMRLFQTRNLQIDESALTGESVPVEKKPEALTADSSLGDRRNVAHAATLVTAGQGEGVVYATGGHTETGKIARLIGEAVDLSTPLTRKIIQFSRFLLWIILGLATLTFIVGVLRGNSPFQMFLGAVALAVGAIPEGLPAAVTISLALGVARMAKRRAIIRKLPAVETLGSTTVICSDKTGTLTENQMTVRQIYAGGRTYDVTGNGYEPLGEILCAGKTVNLDDDIPLRELLLAGVLNNDSQIARKGDHLQVEGDPTEAALIVAAQKVHLVPDDLHNAHPRLDVIPFESEFQFMATLHQGAHPRPGSMIYKKGSVERLLERSTNALGLNGTEEALNPDSIHLAVERMTRNGLRVLAFARREVDANHSRLLREHVEGGLTFLGLQGMMDPPRAEAISSIRKCTEAGIVVKMITGDHALTARSIAQQLGLRSQNGELISVTGRELEAIPEAELPALAERAVVFARVAPEQKVKLVRALQSRGHVVAMTGDGVNDAPALKQADIGVAMGITGTEVAKGAADMILTDDNFASIEAAVEEGRGVFDNLAKFIIWTIPTNLGEALILLTAIFIGTALPALPLHLLWINLVTAILLGLVLVLEPKDRDIMQRPPRTPNEPIITFPLFMRTGLVALILLAGSFGAFLWEQNMRGKSVIEARTTVVNVIVMVEIFYLLNCRSMLQSIFTIGVFSNPWVFLGIASMLTAQILFTHAPFMNRLFHTAPLDAGSWFYVFSIGVCAFCVVEFEKWVRRRTRKEKT